MLNDCVKIARPIRTTDGEGFTVAPGTQRQLWCAMQYDGDDTTLVARREDDILPADVVDVDDQRYSVMRVTRRGKYKTAFLESQRNPNRR